MNLHSDERLFVHRRFHSKTVFGTELLLIYIIWYSPLRCAASVNLPGPVLLVTAHPDDEAMFFTPTLLWLQKAGIPVDLLCFSVGDFDGLGSVRHTELLNAAKHFGIRQLRVIDNPDEFPDNPCAAYLYRMGNRDRDNLRYSWSQFAPEPLRTLWCNLPRPPIFPLFSIL
ncbi:hypothetical protein AHF37_02311 [Paragonimus kellicotti]|nr:hypothetical protein AHF37_02311 [Paragonimus kellicotti]